MNPYSTRLLETMHVVTESWLRSLVERVMTEQSLMSKVDTDRMDRMISDARRELLDRLGELLAEEAWEQRRNPLELVRRATIGLTTELLAAGARPVARDEFKERSFPDDVLDLAPATWSDVHSDLHDVGLEWGAWKAAAIITHRRSMESSGSVEESNT
ncbi:MAG: hypothetical protein RIS41_15 [Actinomycetota bacterium]|jgi:acyl-CoA reductase-like NAD-dependent aldehyde dehydrogenase